VLTVPAPALAGLAAALAAAVAAPAAPPDARFACLKLLCDATLARLCCATDAAGTEPNPALSLSIARTCGCSLGPPWCLRTKKVPAADKLGRAPAACGHARQLHFRCFTPALYPCPIPYTLRQRRTAGRAEGEALAAQRLLPLVPGLLRQGDPMPLFTLKLTCAVLDAAPACAVPVLQRRAPRAGPRTACAAGRSCSRASIAVGGRAPPRGCTAGGLLRRRARARGARAQAGPV